MSGKFYRANFKDTPKKDVEAFVTGNLGISKSDGNFYGDMETNADLSGYPIVSIKMPDKFGIDVADILKKKFKDYILLEERLC